MISSTLFDLDTPVWDDSLDIRPVGLHTAERWYGSFHYSGTPGSTNATFYGAFSGDMIALVAIALPTNPHGVAGRTGLDPTTGNHEISRVAVHPQAPRNTASRCIAAAARVHHDRTGLLWLFSYADTAQGHHGGIYQALNAIYVGPGVDGARAWYRIDGEPVHARTMVSRYGTMSAPALKARFGDRLEITERSQKHTYILPIGPPATRRTIRATLTAIAQPYPKRSMAAADCNTTTVPQSAFAAFSPSGRRDSNSPNPHNAALTRVTPEHSPTRITTRDRGIR